MAFQLDPSLSWMLVVIRYYLSATEADSIYEQFNGHSWLPNRQVLWESVQHGQVEAWAQRHEMQTLTIALGPLMKHGHPKCLVSGMSKEHRSRFMTGAGAIFAWFISKGEAVTVLCRPPPDCLHPSHDTHFQKFERPIVTKFGRNRFLRIYMVHPDIEAADDCGYQIWPEDESWAWIERYGNEPYQPRPWRAVADRPLQLEPAQFYIKIHSDSSHMKFSLWEDDRPHLSYQECSGKSLTQKQLSFISISRAGQSTKRERLAGCGNASDSKPSVKPPKVTEPKQNKESSEPMKSKKSQKRKSQLEQTPECDKSNEGLSATEYNGEGSQAAQKQLAKTQDSVQSSSQGSKGKVEQPPQSSTKKGKQKAVQPPQASDKTRKGKAKALPENGGGRNNQGQNPQSMQQNNCQKKKSKPAQAVPSVKARTKEKKTAKQPVQPAQASGKKGKGKGKVNGKGKGK